MPHSPPPPDIAASRWQQFLHGRSAVLLTHGSLALLTAALFALLLNGPVWLTFLPCVIVGHRVGVLLHEYIHGIPFRRYRDNLRVVGFFDGLLLMFGLLEVFRGTHLAHHRWLNAPGDPGFQAATESRGAGGVGRRFLALETVQYFRFLRDVYRGRHPYVQPNRIALGVVSSLAWIAFWILAGQPGVPLQLMAVSVFTTLGPVTFRAAIEHYSHEGDPGFSNEYRVLIPLFNLNRHAHHHEQPRLPWYLLRYRTERPLSTWHYFTYWYRVHVRRDYVLMRPMPAGFRSTQASSAGTQESVAVGADTARPRVLPDTLPFPAPRP